MSISARRVRAIFGKELREYRHNGSIVWAMAILPLLFLVQPMIQVFALPATASGALRHEHSLLYLLAIPAIVPALVAAYAVAGERQQGTLEPVLTTPVRREEFLLGKALAVLLPSAGIAYAVYTLFLACVAAFANPAVASSLLRWQDILVQVLLTPPIAAWSIWLGMSVSARSHDVRVAQQFGMLASLPTMAVTSLIALNVIHLAHGLGAGLVVALLALDGLGWRMTSAAFNRERLITGTR
jgi:ABC-2 type transport system permease protein